MPQVWHETVTPLKNGNGADCSAGVRTHAVMKSSPENAMAEVRRSLNGSYAPLYQAAHLLGALQLYSLHKEMVDSAK